MIMISITPSLASELLLWYNYAAALRIPSSHLFHSHVRAMQICCRVWYYSVLSPFMLRRNSNNDLWPHWMGSCIYIFETFSHAAPGLRAFSSHLIRFACIKTKACFKQPQFDLERDKYRLTCICTWANLWIEWLHLIAHGAVDRVITVLLFLREKIQHEWLMAAHNSETIPPALTSESSRL